MANDIFSEEDFLPSNNVTYNSNDFASDEALPSYANGLSPEAPINQSIIDPMDRLKLSVGNEAGKIKFLEERYGKVQRAGNGDLLIQDKRSSLWHRVDPEGLGDGDAWEQTKEALADIADVAPTVTMIGAQVGAAALTGGTSIPAQAALAGGIGGIGKGIETSLGRLVGTYEASDEDQLKDIAIESIMNIGGTTVAAGIKPTAALLAKGLREGAKKIGLSSEPVKNSMKQFLGVVSGAGERNVTRLIERPDQVSSNLKYTIQELVDESISDTKTISKAIRPALTNTYGKISKEIVDTVDDSFKPGINKMISNVNGHLESIGLGKNVNGKFIPISEKEMKALAESTGEFSELYSDESSRKLVLEAVEALNKFSGIKELDGKAGAAQLLKVRRSIFDITHKLQEEATDSAFVPAQRIIAQIKEVADSSIIRNFDLKSPVNSSILGEVKDNMLVAGNKFYSDVMNEVSPVLRVASQANKQGSDVPFQTFYNKLKSVTGSNEIQKKAFDKAVNVLRQYGDDSGKLVAGLKDNIDDRIAAEAFSPSFKKGIINQGIVTGAIASGVTGNLTLATTLGAASLITSPRLQLHSIKAAMAGKNFLANLGPKGTAQLLSNPAAVQAFTQAVLQTPLAQEDIKQNLIQQGMGVAHGR